MKKASKKKIPKRLQAVLWSTNVDLLDLKRHKEYIIHQVLSYGRLEDIRWLFRTYKKESIIKVFVTAAYKDYTASRFYFVKQYLLNLRHHPLDERLYVKNIPRRLD